MLVAYPRRVFCTEYNSTPQGRTGFSNRPWQKYQSSPFDHGSIAIGAYNGWGPGPPLGPRSGSRGQNPRENLGFYAILGVGECGFSDDFLKQKS